jgi:hypothetical protein
MSSTTTFKCLNCNEKHRCEPRKRGSQRYCPKPDCRRASKAASQRKWAARPENQNYFRGTDNCERVRQWRLAHPGYWRNKRSALKGTLQEISKLQTIGNEMVAESEALTALQEICLPQPALLVGLISVLTGHALQEDLVASARLFLLRGHDILTKRPKVHDSSTKGRSRANALLGGFGGNYAPTSGQRGTQTSDTGLMSKGSR